MNEPTRLLLGREMVEEMQKNIVRLDASMNQEFISRNLRRYAGQLMVIDFATWEAKAYAQQGLVREAAISLADARRALDSVAFILHPEVSKPLASNKIPLYELAKSRYDEAVNAVQTKFGEAA